MENGGPLPVGIPSLLSARPSVAGFRAKNQPLWISISTFDIHLPHHQQPRSALSLRGFYHANVMSADNTFLGPKDPPEEDYIRFTLIVKYIHATPILPSTSYDIYLTLFVTSLVRYMSENCSPAPMYTRIRSARVLPSTPYADSKS